jgi:hypothetical protein
MDQSYCGIDNTDFSVIHDDDDSGLCCFKAFVITAVVSCMMNTGFKGDGSGGCELAGLVLRLGCMRRHGVIVMNSENSTKAGKIPSGTKLKREECFWGGDIFIVIDFFERSLNVEGNIDRRL